MQRHCVIIEITKLEKVMANFVIDHYLGSSSLTILKLLLYMRRTKFLIFFLNSPRESKVSHHYKPPRNQARKIPLQQSLQSNFGEPYPRNKKRRLQFLCRTELSTERYYNFGDVMVKKCTITVHFYSL